MRKVYHTRGRQRARSACVTLCDFKVVDKLLLCNTDVHTWPACSEACKDEITLFYEALLTTSGHEQTH